MIGPALTNIVASDIDGDGYTEIIVANEYRRFYMALERRAILRAFPRVSRDVCLYIS